MSWQRVGDSLSLAERDIRDKGEDSEVRVEEALRSLIQRGEIFNYYRPPRDGEYYKNGWDFLVFPDDDWIIPLQVKSSDYGKQEHTNKYGLRIPCVVVKGYYSPREMEEIVLVALGISNKGLREILEATEHHQLDTLGEALREVLTQDPNDAD